MREFKSGTYVYSSGMGTSSNAYTMFCQWWAPSDVLIQLNLLDRCLYALCQIDCKTCFGTNFRDDTGSREPKTCLFQSFFPTFFSKSSPIFPPFSRWFPQRSNRWPLMSTPSPEFPSTHQAAQSVPNRSSHRTTKTIAYLEVSWNGGPPKWMVYQGKSHLEMDDN